MYVKLSGIVVLLLAALLAAGQEKEYRIQTNPFLERILDFSQHHESFYQTRKDRQFRLLPFKGPRNQFYRQELLKTDSNFYVYYSATGILYKYSGRVGNDSLRFLRMDSTEHYGYNINCFAFAYREEVYNFGGYGFWQWTGHLRKFDFNSHEWVISKTNREVPVITRDPLPCIWYDSKRSHIYTLQHFTANESVKTEALTLPTRVDSVMQLDLNTLNWQSLGTLTAATLQLIENSQVVANYAGGIVYVQNGHFLLLDFRKNDVKMMKCSGSMNEVKFTTRNKDYISFVKDSTIYFYEFSDGTLDSLLVKDKYLSSLQQPIYQPSAPFASLYPTLGGVLVLMLLVLNWHRLKMLFGKSKTNTIADEIQRAPLSPNVETYNQSVFSSIEMDLIRKILDNSIQMNRKTSVDEVNYVLGVANKTTDMQKRKRSNTIRSINEKYAIVTKQPEYQLIKRERNEQDARSNEFYIEEVDFGFFWVS